MSKNPYETPASELDVQAPKKGYLELFALSFLRHWNGRAKLISAFWGHFILGNLIFTLIFAIGSRILKAVTEESNVIITIIHILLVVLSVIYYICTVRFIWVCAPNVKYSGYFYITRGLIVLVVLSLLGIFSITFYEAVSSFGQ